MTPTSSSNVSEMSKADPTQVLCVKDWHLCLWLGNPRHGAIGLHVRQMSLL
jgi:hypothetical protein